MSIENEINTIMEQTNHEEQRIEETNHEEQRMEETKIDNSTSSDVDLVYGFIREYCNSNEQHVPENIKQCVFAIYNQLECFRVGQRIHARPSGAWSFGTIIKYKRKHQPLSAEEANEYKTEKFRSKSNWDMNKISAAEGILVQHDGWGKHWIFFDYYSSVVCDCRSNAWQLTDKACHCSNTDHEISAPEYNALGETRENIENHELICGFIRGLNISLETVSGYRVDIPSDLETLITNIYNNFLLVGDRFETRDKYGTWYIAKIERYILEEDPLKQTEEHFLGIEGIFVHFEGFEGKYDEEILFEYQHLFCDCRGRCRHDNGRDSDLYCHRLTRRRYLSLDVEREFD